MFSRLDRYLIRTFIPSFLVCSFIFLGIYLVVDIFQKLDDLFALGDKALPMALNYYSLFLPTMMVKLFPAIILMATGFVLVKLSKGNELLAMQIAGLSLYRILLPLFVTVAILSLMAMGNQEFLIPSFAYTLERTKTITFDRSELKNLFLEDRTKNIVISVARYDVVEETMKSIFILGRDKNKGELYTVNTKEGKWVGNNTWYLTDLVKNNYKEGKWVAPTEEIKEYFLETEITPADMREEERDPSLMSLLQMRSQWKKEPEDPRYPVFFYSRLAYPFTSLVLMLLGVPFIVGFQKLRKNLFLSISTLMGVVCSYFIISMFCTNLGITGNLHPLLAGWLPVLAFATIGVLLFDWMGA